MKHYLLFYFLFSNTGGNVIKLLNNFATIASEAKYRTIQGEGIKILTFKQVLLKLPIVFAQIKPGSTSNHH